MYAEKKKSNQLEQVQSKKSRGVYAENKEHYQLKPVRKTKPRGVYIERRKGDKTKREK